MEKIKRLLSLSAIVSMAVCCMFVCKIFVAADSKKEGGSLNHVTYSSTSTTDRTTIQYKTISIKLDVDDTYKPTLEFVCEISQSESYWGITRISSVRLNRNGNDCEKQFGGAVEYWLRSPYQIEYIVNGDFFDAGMTNTKGGDPVKTDEHGSISFSISKMNWLLSATDHYAYFYVHDTKQFQY